MTSKQISIRVDPGFYEALTRRAREEGRSLAGQVKWEVVNSWCQRMGQEPDEMGVDDSDGVNSPVDGTAAQGSALR
jgi:hypothetical protein